MRALRDRSATQMHRRAVAGKKLVAHLHNACVFSIRVAGQFIDHALFGFSTRRETEEACEAVAKTLEGREPPVSLDEYSAQT